MTIDVHHEFDQLRTFYEATASLLDQPDEVLFEIHEGVSGWSPGHHLYHIWLANGKSLAAVLYAASGRGNAEGRPNKAGRLVLERGSIPRNRLSAPAMVQPPEDIDRTALEEALDRSREKLAEVEAQLDALSASEGRLEHPRMGPLNAEEWLRFVRIHSEHHHAIVREILDADPNPNL